MSRDSRVPIADAGEDLRSGNARDVTRLQLLVATLRFVEPELLNLVRCEIGETRDDHMSEAGPFAWIESECFGFEIWQCHHRYPGWILPGLAE